MVKTAASSSSASPEHRAASNELKYKGVRKRKWGKYVSEIRLTNSRERIWLGSYETAEKAARAFDAALFCLRGPNAKFNFPDDPPDFAAGCQALTPAQIQAFAQHYSNQPRPPPPPGPRAVELDDAVSPSSNSDEGADAEPMGSIDWSFLDVLDSDRTGNVGHVSDFGLFHEPGDMYMPSHLAERSSDDDNDDGGNGGSVPSFLWNF